MKKRYSRSSSRRGSKTPPHTTPTPPQRPQQSLQRSLSVVRSSSKYVYLTAFFAMLAGFFHPLITNTSTDSLVMGVLVLFVGLGGGMLLYKAATGVNKRGVLLAVGLGLITLSLYGMFQVV